MNVDEVVMQKKKKQRLLMFAIINIIHKEYKLQIKCETVSHFVIHVNPLCTYVAKLVLTLLQLFIQKYMYM